jgi:antitoxin YefM
MTYSESRAHYAETLNAVVDDREEVVITRSGHDGFSADGSPA